MFGIKTPFEQGPVNDIVFPDIESDYRDETGRFPQPMLRRVYLAGPISGCDYNTATDWREQVTEDLAKYGIQGMSPMRCKSYLKDLADLGVEDVHKMNATSTARGIMTRDRYDCTNCDVLLVNFLGAKRISVGTVMEIAWADLCRTPTIVAMEKDNIHRHAMVDEAVGFRVDTLEEAVEITKGILVG
jgi:nucleoside 2-deoxyribosyltransferase